MYKAIALAALGASLAFSGGCRRTSHQTVELDLAPTTGILALDVDHFRGDVTVFAGSGDRTIEIQGTVRIDGGKNKAHKRRMHDAVSIDAQLEEDGARGILRVRTSSERAVYDDHRMHLTIRVPRCDGVRIENHWGAVNVYDAAGSAEIHATAGPIQFLTTHPITDPVVLTAVDGLIWYQVPDGSTGAFDLQTLDGHIWYRERVSGMTTDAVATPTTFQGVLEDDTNSVIARTNNGDINVWVVNDPMAIRRAFPNARPSVQDKLFGQTSRRHRRNLPIDHPEVTGLNEWATRRAFQYE